MKNKLTLHLFSVKGKLLFIFASLFMLSSCSIKLVPTYDQNIVDGIIDAQSATYELLAQLDGGTVAVDYGKHEEKYNEIIGKLESLDMVINTRPMPDNKKMRGLIEKVNKKINDKYPGLGGNVIPLDFTKAPSSVAVANILKTIRQIKKEDKARGIAQDPYNAYKNLIVLYFDQALTYEQFLKQ